MPLHVINISVLRHQCSHVSEKNKTFHRFVLDVFSTRQKLYKLILVLASIGSCENIFIAFWFVLLSLEQVN